VKDNKIQVCLCGCGRKTLRLKYFYNNECEEQHCRNENARYAVINTNRAIQDKENRLRRDQDGCY
jgi:hypothetical protein